MEEIIIIYLAKIIRTQRIRIKDLRRITLKAFIFFFHFKIQLKINFKYNFLYLINLWHFYSLIKIILKYIRNKLLLI